MIQTGCTKTPLPGSYFCELHKTQDTKRNFKFRKSFLSIDIKDIKGTHFAQLLL
jgi:hypothetical protein